MISYNIFLFNERKKLNMSRRDFAKMLHISWLKYCAIENGYVKPNKKNILSINEALGIDFTPYTLANSSYATILPEKEKRPIVKKFYDFLGSTKFRIAMAILFALSIASVVTAIIFTDKYETNSRDFHEEKVTELYDAVIANGTATFDLLNAFVRKEVYEESLNKLITIKAHLHDSDISDMEFKIDTWTDEYRLSLVFISTRAFLTNIVLPVTRLYKTPTIIAKYVDYRTNDYFEIRVEEYSKDSFEIVKYKSSLISTDMEFVEEEFIYACEVISHEMQTYNQDFEDLIDNLLYMKVDLYEDIMMAMIRTNKTIKILENITEVMYLSGVIMTLLTLFGFIYSTLFRTKNGICEFEFSNDTSFYHKETNKVMKKDISFTPFLPETLLELIGIAIVFVASFRMLIYFGFALGVYQVTFEQVKEVNNVFMPIFYVGMFLLYFIDFDKFMGDKRTIRNIFMYFLLFIGLYVIEIYLLSFIRMKESVVFSMVEMFTFPNMFGTISMYFLIMFLLFFTPKFINNKRRLVIFRLLSLIPTLLIFAMYFIFKSANYFWGWNLSVDVLYIFDSERIAFSFLCVFYLYGLFFLRLYFKKKYGDKEAQRFFNGNRYIFIKNILMCVIIGVVAIVEFLLRYNKTANQLGLGQSYYIYILIPLVLFYHPHKGDRKTVLDWIITALYMASVSAIIIALMVVAFFG